MKSIVKNTLFSLVLSLASMPVMAQVPENHPNHENHYDVKPIETADLKIEFSGAHSQQAFTTVKLKITNKTNDYILYKSTETVFKYAHGDVQVKGSGMFKVSSVLIEPKSTETVTLKVTGGTNFHVKDLKVDLKGFNKVNANGKVFTTPNFSLPATVNNFHTGPFECFLLKAVQKTDETKAHFECVYKGSQVGILVPANPSVTADNIVQKYANENRKDRAEILYPNDRHKFNVVARIPGQVVDMQKSILMIEWNNTFSESTANSLNIGLAEFVFNQTTTTEKNK